METEIEILFFAVFANFLIDPLVWLLSILLAFVSRKKHFLVRVTFIWVAMFLMTLLVLGEMRDYQYIAVSIANFIIAIISTLIMRPKRFDGNNS
jgi:preprotein translocase subunit SecG